MRSVLYLLLFFFFEIKCRWRPSTDTNVSRWQAFTRRTHIINARWVQTHTIRPGTYVYPCNGSTCGRVDCEDSRSDPVGKRTAAARPPHPMANTASTLAAHSQTALHARSVSSKLSGGTRDEGIEMTRKRLVERARILGPFFPRASYCNA